jgi:hypothetical protein
MGDTSLNHPSGSALAVRAQALARVLALPLSIVCTLAALQPSLGHAQGRPYRYSNETRLTKDDLDARDAAARQLLDRPQLTDGGFEVWNSPSSGTNGTIVAGKAVQRHGLACRQLTYFTSVAGPGPRPNRTTEVVWCKTAAGWKLG